MRSAGGKVKVAKNRLVKLALEGTDAKGIADLLKGPTCLAYSDGPDRGTEGRRQIRQGEREVRDPWRRDGSRRCWMPKG